MKARRRIQDAKITHVSLCKRGANSLPVLFKSDGEQDIVEATPIAKYDEDKGEMTALVYVPDHVDKDGDTATAEAIRKMAHSWSENGSQVDINHDLKTLSRDQVYVAENFIVQKGDQRFEGWTDLQGNPIDATGGWAQIYKFNDPALRELAKSGEIGGVSMYGPAVVEQLTKSDHEAIAREVLETLRAGQSSANPDNEIDMKPEELDAKLEKFQEGLLAKVGEIVTKSAEAPEEKPEDKPAADDKPETPEIEFEGDRTDPEAIAKHAEKLELAALEKSVDWADAESVRKYSAKLAELKKSDVDEDDSYDEPVTLEKSRSRVGAGDDRPAPAAGPRVKGVHYALGNHRESVALIGKADQRSHLWGVEAARELNRENRAAYSHLLPSND